MELPHIAARNRLLALMARLSASGTTRLPGERELCSRLGVSLMTVKKVIAQLAVEGLIRRVPRSGNYIGPSGRQHSLGILMCDRGDVSFLRTPSVLKGILSVAERNPCSLRVLQLRKSADAINLIRRHHLDAYLWYLPDPSILSQVTTVARKAKLPSLVVLPFWHPAATSLPCCVVTDPVLSWRQRAEYLLARGHRHVARFNVKHDPAADIEVPQHDAFAATLARGGGALRPEWNVTAAEAATLIPQILDQGKVTAATVNGGGGDRVLNQLFRLIAQHPQAARIELLVDDIGPLLPPLLAEHPGLRIAGVVHTQDQELGELAAQTLIDHLQGGRPLASTGCGVRIGEPSRG